MENAKDKLAVGLVKIFSQPVKMKLSISKIVRIAKINRTTFYRNFSSIEDLIIWFAMRELVFKYEGAPNFNFDYAFKKIFSYIDQFITVFYNLFDSPYKDKLTSFVISEIYAYQMMAFPKIDVDNVVSLEEKKVYSKFYAQGICSLFVEYILNPSIRIQKQTYLVYSLRIVKEYMERAIALTKNKRFEELM
jgi:hypothetical protein